VVDRFRVVRLLARGGMGEIYLAEEQAGGGRRFRVLKRLSGLSAESPEQSRMFLHEARLAAALSHDNIVEVLAVGEFEGVPYIAMEYLHGVDVRAIQKQLLGQGGRVPIDVGVLLGACACAAMHHAHELVGPDGQPLEVVHRDVSPQNLFATFEGAVKLLDFGIARSARRDRETTSSAIKGKVAYMSPEQCLSRTLDRRSDVFSLGIILYELTLGTRLFRGKGDYELMQQIVQGEVVPPRALDPGYPVALEAIVMKALQRPVERRYQTAEAMQHDLLSFARSARLDATPAGLAAFLAATFDEQACSWPRRDQPPPDPPRPAAIAATLEASLPATVRMPAPRTSLRPAAKTHIGPAPAPVAHVARARAAATEDSTPVLPVTTYQGPHEATDSVRPLRPPRRAVDRWAVVALAVVAVAVGAGAFALTRWHGRATVVAAPAGDARRAAPRDQPAAAATPRPPAMAPGGAPTPPVAAAVLSPRTDAAPQAAPRAAAVPAPAEAGYGTAVLTASRPRVRVQLDGRPVGSRTPLILSRIAAATEHVLSISRGPRTAPVVQRFVVPRGGTVELFVNVEPAGGAALHARGRRRAASDEPVKAAASSRFPAKKAKGGARVAHAAPARNEATATRGPASSVGDATTSGTVRVACAGHAAVAIDGKAIGRTPVQLRLPVGPHVVLVRDDATGGRQRLPITVTAGKVTVVDVEFD